ncbi:MAG TPA: glycosyltransferase family 2 protein [Rubricoccaceae bacterium]
MPDCLAATYVLPLRSDIPVTEDLAPYLARLSYLIDDLIVVDGSPDAVFATHAEAFGRFGRHLRPETVTPMGKVGNVLTGLQHARHERVVIADDDVRYSPEALREVVGRLAGAHVVRPQNVFAPLPWHARWDTGRQLLNRMTGGDWPGTLAVRRSALPHGYRGDVMFENLELVRTVVAGGGREHVALDVFVERRPPHTSHFGTQRVRQAYDEWARPERLAVQLAVLPTVVTLAARGRWRALGAGVLGVVALAEAGRRRGAGRRVYGPTAALWAPLWVGERAVTSWLAVGARALRGGVAYRGGRLAVAATPLRRLRRIHGADAGPRHGA